MAIDKTLDAIAFLNDLFLGKDPGSLPDLGEFTKPLTDILEAYRIGSTGGDINSGIEAGKRAYEALARDNRKLRLLRPQEDTPKTSRSKSSSKFMSIAPTVAQLPEIARLPEGLSAGACQWLLRYIEFSKKWSPRGYEGFHEAIALWVLSTIAARRVCMPLGPKRQYTPLYIALVARSGLYAKSTTAAIGTRMIKQAGLGFLLAGDDYTPQAFLSSLTGIVPPNYLQLHGDAQDRAWMRVAFAAQRGWYFDEFSQIIQEMRKKSGHMGPFSAILRRLDDGEDEYTYGTIGRGEDKIINPYLAMLVNMTPADLRDSGKRGSDLWGNGFFARMAFIGPDRQEMGEGRLPNELFQIPSDLIMPLQAWHQQLESPAIEIEPDKDIPGKFVVHRGPFPEHMCTFGDGVEDAYNNYCRALSRLIKGSDDEDLDSNYVRFGDKALRIAMLVASLENGGRIEMPHWALAQEISEHWRSNLHCVFAQINDPLPSFLESLEQKIMHFVERWTLDCNRPPTMREIRNWNKGVDSHDLLNMVRSMVATEKLQEITAGKTKVYRVPVEEPSDEVIELAVQIADTQGG